MDEYYFNDEYLTIHINMMYPAVYHVTLTLRPYETTCSWPGWYETHLQSRPLNTSFLTHQAVTNGEDLLRKESPDGVTLKTTIRRVQVCSDSNSCVYIKLTVVSHHGVVHNGQRHWE